jgi:UDP-N-acetylmuramate dehydrogenase
MERFSGFEHIVRDNEPLAAYTWFRLGGPAQYFAEPTSIDELTALVRRCRDAEVPVRLLGGGSNVLVRDEGTPGLVLHLSAPAFCDISVRGQTVKAGGGAKLGHVVSMSVREGLTGLEQLVGIPGTVGGALHGNAGNHGGDIGQWTDSATVLTRSGELLTRRREDLHFAHRQSSLDELVILNAKFELEAEDPREVTKRMQKLWIVKKANQPMGNQPTGCIFKDPGGVSAASLIEQAGLKGTRIGEAEVSDQHANFIVITGRGASQDVLRLIDLMRSRVSERLGVDLELEIEIW